MQAYGGYLRGICLLAGYLLGGFLTAEAVARSLTGKSARALGTGNPGMANITAQLGKAAGFAVLAGDVAKTVLAVWFCVRYAAPELGRTAVLYAGLGAILGHNWSVWHGFHGGKGIAHAAITAHLMNLPMGYVRSGHKDHGRGNQIEGKLEKGQKVVVVEDLISTGGSVLEVVDVLREAGAEVLGVASIFTYGMQKGLDRLAVGSVVGQIRLCQG